MRRVLATWALSVAVIGANGTVATAALIPLNNFESSLGDWSANAVASTGRYVHQASLQPTDDTSTNFASGGTGAASLGKSGGSITSGTYDLTGGGNTESLTLSFDFVWHNGTTTRRANVEYSSNGGTTWFNLATIQLGGSVVNKSSYAGSVTITEGTNGSVRTGSILTPNGGTAYNGSAFGSSSVFRIINLASAGADARLFIDNLEVTSTVPEPASLALLGVVALAGSRRRR